MTHEEIIQAITNLTPKAEWTFSGNNYSDLVWLSAGLPPTIEEITAEISNFQIKNEQEKIDKENARLTVETKLIALGLTADDLEVLGL